MDTLQQSIRIMTSGAFAQALFNLLNPLQERTGKSIIVAATRIGTGENAIPNRLKSGEAVEVVVVVDSVLKEFIRDGLILTGTETPVARSVIGMAVRAGSPALDIGSLEALKQTLLAAKSVAYSASVSGQYLINELYPRLGIVDRVMAKSRLISGGERVGEVVARGEAEIGFQQVSELLPIAGIDHITPLPPEVQKVSLFSAGIATTAQDRALAQSAIAFFTSPEAVPLIASSGLEPVG